MSFYGNVFYELTNAFDSFIIQSKFDDEDSKKILKAVGTGGDFTFAPGNHWIELNADSKNYILNINHAMANPDQDGNNINPFSKTTETVETPINLTAGDIIAVPTLKYDAAGHIIETDSMSYYKLPMNETETNIEDLRERMNEIEGAEAEQNNQIKEFANTIQNYDETLTTLDDRVVNVEALGSEVKELQNTSDVVVGLLGERKNMTKEEDLTITEIIGNFDNLLDTFKCNNLSNGVGILAQEVTAANSSINNNALAAKLAIKNLCEALKENGINIDHNSLWEV